MVSDDLQMILLILLMSLGEMLLPHNTVDGTYSHRLVEDIQQIIHLSFVLCPPPCRYTIKRQHATMFYEALLPPPSALPSSDLNCPEGGG